MLSRNQTLNFRYKVLIQLKILEKYYLNKGTIFIVLTSTKSLFVILKLGIADKENKLKPI